MSTNQIELANFQRFVRDKLHGDCADHSLEEYVRQWRAEQYRAETIESVRRGVRDVEAGRTFSIRELEHEIRQERHSSSGLS